MGTIVDIAKVQFAVEDFEAVEGLPESVFATEGFAFATICSSPAFSSACSPRCIWFPSCTARLSLCWAWRPYPGEQASGLSPKAALVCVIGFVCAVAAELAATAGMSLIDWEAEWAESGTALAVGMVCAAALAVIVLLVMKRNKERNAAC